MNFRPTLLMLLVAGCVALTSRECLAQRHPATTRTTTQVAPLPSHVRLVQATNEDLDDVLGTARDLLDQLDADDSGAGDLDLDSGMTPQPAQGVSESPNLPRTLDEYRQRKTTDSLQNGQTGPVTEDGNEDAELDLDSLAGDDEAGPPTGIFSRDRYQDVMPAAVPRRVRGANIPYTLGDILDDDKIDPACEREFCRRMWQCAGGRGQSPWHRMKRDMDRDKLLRKSPQCLTSPFSEPFICPKGNSQCNCEARHGADSYPGYSRTPEGFVPVDGGTYTSDPYESYGAHEHGPVLDDFEVAPRVLDGVQDALDMSPIPQHATGERIGR